MRINYVSLVTIGLVCLLSSSSGYSSNTGDSKPKTALAELKPESDKALEDVVASFKAKAASGARLEEGKILHKHLKPGMSRAKVRELLGEPNANHSKVDYWFYTIWYSRFIGLQFAGDNVIKVDGG